MTRAVHLLIDRTDPQVTRLVEEELEPMGDGEVIVGVDRVAMTANNVTYASIAHLIPYWEFFPTRHEGWGRLPVWGFADVQESTVEDIPVGMRLFGFWPSSTHLRMRPRLSGAQTVIDEVAHRQSLPSTYNQYTPADQGEGPDVESAMCVFRPLFMTAFAIDDLYGMRAFDGASTLVCSSASSKTAWATAHLLAKRLEVQLVGLTSAGNRGFVEGLGCYHRVVTYDAIDDLGADAPAAYFDFAGSQSIRRELRHALGPSLKLDVSVGIAHRTDVDFDRNESDPPITFFFAPSTIKERSRELGRDVYFARYAEAWAEFVPETGGRIAYEEGEGMGALASAYEDTINVRVPPSTGRIVRPGG